jgi:hypothetical protein
MDLSGTKAHDSDMTLALGMTFLTFLVVALWAAGNEPAEAAGLVRQVDPDQTDDESAWDLLGWHSFG